MDVVIPDTAHPAVSEVNSVSVFCPPCALEEPKNRVQSVDHKSVILDSSPLLKSVPQTLKSFEDTPFEI